MAYISGQGFTSTGGGGGTDLSGYINQMEIAAQKAQAANIARQKKIEDIMNEVIARYQPGGGFGKGYEATLEAQKTKEVGAGTQALISSGLYGTEMGAGVGRAWEASVGAPARLKLEDIRYEALSKAQMEKAGFLERIEEPYPDYGMLAQLAAQAANVAQPISSMGGGRSTGFMQSYAGAGEEPSYQTKPYDWTEYNRRAEATASVAPAGKSTVTPVAKPAGTSLKYTPELGYGVGIAPTIKKKEKTMTYTSGGSFGGGYTYQ